MCIFHAPHGRGGRFNFFFLWLREAACFARPSCFQCLQVAVPRPGSILSMGWLPPCLLPAPTVAVARRPSLLLSARLGCLPDAIAPHRAAVSSTASGFQPSHGKPSFILPPSSFSARGGRGRPWLRMNSSICLAPGACDHCRHRFAHHFFRPLSTPILLCKVSTSGVWQGRTSCLAQYLFQTFWALRAWPKTPGHRGEKHIGHPLPLHAFSLFAALCA